MLDKFRGKFGETADVSVSCARKDKSLSFINEPIMRIPFHPGIAVACLMWALLPAGVFAQLGNPIEINVRNAGTAYVDQFPASTNYTYGIVEDVSMQLGLASITVGSGSNTLKVTFTPQAGAVGTDDLIVTYFTLDDPAHPVTRWYRFTVTPQLITIGNDAFLVDSGVVNMALDVLANDTASAGPLTLSTVSVSNDGTASINASGDTIRYTPDSVFTGDAWIQYVACDTTGQCAKGVVRLLVRNPDQQNHVTLRKFVLNTGKLPLLTPFEGFTIENEPGSGSVTATGDFGWVYTPNAGYVGMDTFKLSLGNLVSRTYIVRVLQKNVNTQAVDDKFYVRPGLSVTFNVLNNDLLDFEYSSHTNPTRGILYNGGNGSFTYTPNTSFRGVDKFTYTACYEDTVYCETATVLLHVTDLEPENVVRYKIQTSRDLPVVIDWPLVYTDFAYIISEDPTHGDFEYFPGVQTVTFPCDSLEGYNLLTYTPDPGFTGEDHFEYYFCVVPSNICYRVVVDVEVIDPPAQESCPCVMNCVWPGDADLDGRVDMADLLQIGYRMGEAGIARDYADPAFWFGQHADPWPLSGNGIDHKFADANGDGKVSEADVDVVNEYYQRTHDIIVKDVQQKLPYQFSIIPVQFSLDSGDVVILNISVGTPAVPVLDMSGIKFTVNIPPAMLDSASVEVDFHSNSWLAEGTPSVSLAKVPWDGRIDAGYAKAARPTASGHGVIATIVFIIEDDIEGFKSGNGLIEVPVRLDLAGMTDADGQPFELDGAEIMLTYRPDPAAPKYDLVLYPNPANQDVNLFLNGQTKFESVAIYDMQGRLVRQIGGLDTKQHRFNVSDLPSGLYVVQATHTHGVVTEVLSVIR